MEHKYTLTIDINVLEHLGINLYSNVPAVLTEIVANAWDADATKVEITIDKSAGSIEIEDDGVGMTSSEINSKFLWVGYQRRSVTGDTSPSGRRPVMGRKGVGKLAPFSIANKVEVHSTKDGEKSALRMDVDDIRTSGGMYHPEEIENNQSESNKGTRIVLNDLKKERVFVENLVQRLARRFSVIGTEEFRVFVKDTRKTASREVTNRDRGDLDKLQYLWIIGDWEAPDWLSVPESRIQRLPARPEGWENPNWKISGWIGTVYRPKDLEGAAGNLNEIVLLARGRLFQENIMGKINDGRHYLKYIVGNIQADYLDWSDQVDIATSDRQRVQEDDERIQSLIAYLKLLLNKIEPRWSEWRIEDGREEVKARHPAVQEWLESLDKGHRKHAEKMIGMIKKFESEDPSSERVLLRHAILGFERAKLYGTTHELSEAVGVGSEKVLELLSNLDDYEASLYSDIIKNRLEIIRMLKSKIDANELESSLQNYFFDHLWLLDPSWERAQGSEIMEKSINKEFDKISEKLTDEERRGRIDIKYRKATGEHVIIELKRPERIVSVQELVTQARKYINALRKCLDDNGRGNETHQIVFVVGKPLKESSEYDGDQFIKSQLSSIGATLLRFDQLVNSAYEGYSEYIEKRKLVDKVDKISRALDNEVSKKR